MKYRNAVLIVLLIIILDQVSKVYVKTHFYYGEEVNVIGTWFKLHFIENEGMAFGMKLSQAAMGKLILTLFRLVAVIFGFFLLKKLVDKQYSRGAIICGALILAGALGNLIDSMFYGMIFEESTYSYAAKMFPAEGYAGFLHGRVVDMLYFPIIKSTWPSWLPFVGGEEFEFFSPIFNIADASISVGVITLFVFQKKFFKKHHEEEKHPTVETSTEISDKMQVG